MNFFKSRFVKLSDEQIKCPEVSSVKSSSQLAIAIPDMLQKAVRPHSYFPNSVTVKLIKRSFFLSFCRLVDEWMVVFLSCVKFSPNIWVAGASWVLVQWGGYILTQMADVARLCCRTARGAAKRRCTAQLWWREARTGWVRSLEHMAS